jgi:NAD(P)-dependent dehydrogenase (short-subunit alcohol dehydrogenase family)
MSDFPNGCGIIFGASGGIGQGIARSMGNGGANLVLAYFRSRAPLEKVREELQALGRQVEIVQCDIRDANAVRDVCQGAHQKYGRIHSVVAATGMLYSYHRVPEMPIEQFRDVIETDVFGLFNIAKASIPLMRDSGGGAIVAIGSNSLGRTLYGNGESAIPKAANAQIIRHIALEEGRKGIRANMVGSGIIEAGMAIAMRNNGEGQNSYAEFLKKVPLRRSGQPAEIGDLVAFLTSSKGSYVSGQIIHCDGGWTA